MKYKTIILLFIGLLTTSGQLFSQSLPVGFRHIGDFYRREQLLGNIGLEHSFASYPLFPNNAFNTKSPFVPKNNINRFYNDNFDGSFKFDGDKYLVRILPVTMENVYNSHHPESWNDGSMIPAKGYQTRFTAGVFLKYDHLSIKLQPEYIYAKNPEFDGFPLSRENPELNVLRWAQYFFHTLNYIDQPERFGDEALNKWFWGQSSIRLTFNSVSFGFSNENLWWGPGMRNSLLMSNTAPGFAHFTLNSVKPIKTAIGSFEGQIVSGWLKNSGYLPPNIEIVDHNGNDFYRPKPDEERYFNGMVVSYQPKWVPGLHLGLIRSFQMYHADMDHSFNAYLPVFSSFFEKNLIPDQKDGEEPEKNNHQKRDQYNSIFMRFIWPESHVEIYGEYGLSDNHWNGRDFVVQLAHSNAFMFGFRKLLLLNNQGADHIELGMELTQLAKNASTKSRGLQTTYKQGSDSWYTSSVVLQGYTHNGQMLGAAIGPGSNVLSVNAGWHRSMKSIGISMERYVHNNDLFFENIKDIRMHWVDISASINGTWDYKNLLFDIDLKFISAKNYQWLFDYNLNDYWDYAGADDVFNFHGKLGITYRF